MSSLFSGGNETNKFLDRLGFTIVEDMKMKSESEIFIKRNFISIPDLEPSNRSREYNHYSIKLRDTIVYEYLFDSVSHRKLVAYIRVSSKDQNEARQLKEMLELGINERDIFIDKESGKDFIRPQYQALKQCLREGDLLYIKSIYRFGRNTKEIKKEWEDITQNIKAIIQVIDMPLLDTTQYKDTLGTFLSDLALQVLAFVSERELDNILQRQAEGISVAKAQGKHLGRPQLNLSTLSKYQRQTLEQNYQKWKSKEITGFQFMTLLGIKKEHLLQNCWRVRKRIVGMH